MPLEMESFDILTAPSSTGPADIPTPPSSAGTPDTPTTPSGTGPFDVVLDPDPWELGLVIISGVKSDPT